MLFQKRKLKAFILENIKLAPIVSICFLCEDFTNENKYEIKIKDKVFGHLCRI